MINMHFVISDTAGSAQVRGYQLAAALGGTVDRCSVSPKGHVDVTVFVKNVPSERQLASAKSHSDFIIYDPIDNYLFGKMDGIQVDAVIACTDKHRLRLEEVFQQTTIKVIPHHHCILDGVTKPPPSASNCIGYIGDSMNLGICNRKLRKIFPDVIVSNDIKKLKEIGIGIAYRPPGIARSYKSGIKLANYWAHGIVVVCSPDAGYLEMMDGSCFLSKDYKQDVSLRQYSKALVASTEIEALSLLKTLVEDFELRRKIVECSSRMISSFNLSNIACHYEHLVEDLQSSSRT